MRSRLLSPVLLMTCALATACVSTLAIRSMQPGRVYVGGTNHLKVLETQGRRSAREFVVMNFMQQTREWGYFTAEDLSEEGIEVRVAGRSVRVDGPEGILASNDAGVRVDVLEWDAERGTERVKNVDENGTAYYRDVPVQGATVLLAFTLFNAEGKTFLAETEYEGVFSTYDMDMGREQVLESAASQAVYAFLRDITPVQVVNHVRLDEEDEGQEYILDMAKSGGVGQAAEDMRGYLERNPHSASAAYNLAVFLESMGDYQGAMEMYDRALTNGGKDFYVEARAGCARRLADTDSLQ